MNSQERITRVLKGEIPDRIPITEISIWPQTIKRWHKEGLPESEDPLNYFEMDRISGFHLDTSFRFERKILEQDEESEVIIDEYGKTVKQWREGSEFYSADLKIDYPIKEKMDWVNLKAMLLPCKERYPKNFMQDYKVAREKGNFITFSPDEPAWFILERTVGFERGLPLFLEEPELALDIMEKVTDLSLSICELAIRDGITPDAIWLYSDLCYKNGMLFSPQTYRKLVMPFHRKIKDFCLSNGLFFIYHSDGNVSEFLPLITEVGIDAIQPLEARCGNDVRTYKRLYGDKITLFGNISAEILSGRPEGIKKEILEKVQVAKAGGRYIFHSDHSIPPSVSLKNYKLAIELVKEIGRYNAT